MTGRDGINLVVTGRVIISSTLEEMLGLSRPFLFHLYLQIIISHHIVRLPKSRLKQ